MLTALDSEGKLCHLLGEFPLSKDYFCPGCGQSLCLKKGKVMCPHFAHKHLRDCHFFSENESVEHLQLKATLYKTISKTEDVRIEKVFPEFGQIADLCINDKLILEVQCSPLPIDRLIERTNAYHREGYMVYWLLGKKLWLRKRLNHLQKQFLAFSWFIGFYLWELDLEKEELRLHYMIHQNLFGKLCYLTKRCSFKDNIMAFLRLPFQKSCASKMTLHMDQEVIGKIKKTLCRRDKSWLKRQEDAYLQGKNLLTEPLETFYPQIRPPFSDIPFCQIHENLQSYYESFDHFYQKMKDKKVQTLYPPFLYVKIKEN